MEAKRKIVFYKNYFEDFFNAQTERVKEKIDYVLFLISVTERISAKFFEQVTGYEGLYEIKVEFESNIYRIFCCFDEGNIIILFNGFQKKTRKAPKNELEKAFKIKSDYFENKGK